MSVREHDVVDDAPLLPTGAPPLSRRQARELEEASRARMPRRSVERRERASRRPAGRPVQARALTAPHAPQSAPRKLLSVGALFGAGILLIGMSVPANAFMGEATALAPAVSTTKAPGQELEVSAEALSAAPVRDGFEVMSYAQQLQLKYANSAPAYTATFGAIRWPFPYAVTITDRFGPRPIEVSGSPFHNGIDFTPGEGTPIYAIADGVVTAHAEDQWGFGNHVIIQHNIPGQNVETLYAHMQYGTSPLVVGQEIKVGDFIGLVGDTGNSYGAHLHFEVHIDKVPVDPFAWLTANAV
ncbi:M23 family metallopeptidase [Salinibacterium soli]|uniref:M23 family metallopeptidase n=1 Tax=Antiquaquibacter soli TaxID=3064523 RepID=A0ABT9BIP1_9MICO|nr:M23 family metallopeptidase [Protaetiibacter sp. WY-16]MDO7880892.1 M23 family metallopeptidase [Protaetiibacter sp. WY-16]